MLKNIVAACLIFLGLAGGVFSQSTGCYTINPTTGAMVWNPTCTPGVFYPLLVAEGKQLTVNNSLTLQGIDNQGLDLSGLPQGINKLGTAALAASQAFQPTGAALNLVGIDNSTSVANGTGTKTWSAVATGLGFTTGMIVTAIETANPATYMQGSVTSYSGTTVTINSTYSQGTFTGTGWTIQISGPQGPTGATGASGEAVGVIVPFGGSSAPANYLLCNGAAVSRTTYSGLYTVIGTTWGAGDGSTTFNVPNLSGRFPLGAGQGATAGNGGTGTNRVLGQMSGGDPNNGGAAPYGAETHTQSGGELEVHNHLINISDPGHTHNQGNVGGNPFAGNTGYLASGATAAPVYTDFYSSLAYTGITANSVSQGGSVPMNIMNPFAVVNYLIRYQ